MRIESSVDKVLYDTSSIIAEIIRAIEAEKRPGCDWNMVLSINDKRFTLSEIEFVSILEYAIRGLNCEEDCDE